MRKGQSLRDLVKLPDYFSLLSITSAILSIISSIQHRFEIAALLIFISFTLDAMDGIVARFMRRRGKFGVELDSIADVIAFGVAPVVFVYNLGLNQPPELVILIAFVLASALRLARFNVIKMRGNGFIGLSTISNGFIVPVIFLVLNLLKVDWSIAQWIYLLWFAFSTILMGSTLRFPKIEIGPH